VHLTLGEYLVVASILVIGSFCQGTVGFGMNLIAAPIVGLVAPQLMPATMVVVGVPMSVAMALRERDHIQWRSVGVISAARIPGTVAGAWLVAIASQRLLGGIIGIVVLVAVGVSLLSNDHDVTDPASVVAGATSGFMDTAAATGGPPVALLFQHRPAAEVRSTLAVVFLAGTAISITGLAVTGSVEPWQLLTAVGLLPAVAIGVTASHRMAHLTAGKSLRPFVLGFAAAAGVAAILKAAVG